MEFPRQLFFTKDHEWLSDDSCNFTVGISAYAIEQLGDIVYLELPAVGDVFSAREPFGSVESTKTVSDLYMPKTGEITAVNSEALEDPELVQEDPYGKGWLIKVKASDDHDDNALMDALSYQKYLTQQEDH